MEKKAITMLPVSNLMHHPKNPRQNIGDVISGRGALWDEYDSLMEEKG